MDNAKLGNYQVILNCFLGYLSLQPFKTVTMSFAFPFFLNRNYFVPFIFHIAFLKYFHSFKFKFLIVRYSHERIAYYFIFSIINTMLLLCFKASILQSVNLKEIPNSADSVVRILGLCRVRSMHAYLL